MKIQQKDLYHGAALTQLVEHDSFKALNRMGTGKYGHYLVNTDRRLMLKYTTEENSPWTFTFQPDDLKILRSDAASKATAFVVLVCGETTVCLLCQAEFSAIIDLSAKSAQWIRVEIPKPGSSMRVRGSSGDLTRVVPHNTFPKAIFE